MRAETSLIYFVHNESDLIEYANDSNGNEDYRKDGADIDWKYTEVAHIVDKYDIQVVQGWNASDDTSRIKTGRSPYSVDTDTAGNTMAYGAGGVMRPGAIDIALAIKNNKENKPQ